jgi:23S rRNA pseudouridine1911/1915/1917 synthase
VAKRKETLDPWKVLEISKAELDAFGGKLRLDRFLANSFPHLSRSKIQDLVASGGVLVDDKKVKASQSLAGGEIVKIDFAQLPVRELNLEPRPLAEPLDILFEDDQIIVINKPAGVTVHPGAGTQGETTLVHAVLHHCGNLPVPRAADAVQGILDDDGESEGEGVVAGSGNEDEGRLRPGIVHRLDRDTTGAMVIAKTPSAHAHLSAQFHDKTNARQYLALCQGTMPVEAVVRESWLGRDPAHRTRFRSFDEEAPGRRYAKTIFRREQEFSGGFTLVSARLYTGRTHQIRVHAQDLGMAVCGDTSYGQPGRLQENLRQWVTRQFLHAWRLGLKHPVSGDWLEFEAPLPGDFAAFMRFLRDAK